MSLEHFDKVDSAGVRDGWAVLSIYHFDEWAADETDAERLRAKLATYEAFIDSIHFQHSYYMAPVRIELHAQSIAPDDIRALCADHGVVLLDPSTIDDE